MAPVAIAIGLADDGFGAIVLPSTKPFLKRVGKKSKNARISCRQSRKADKALRNAAGPSRLTVAIQASNSVAAVAAEVVAYQVRRSSLSCQATAISGNAWAKVARECSSEASRSCLVFCSYPRPTKDKLVVQFSSSFTLKDGEPLRNGVTRPFPVKFHSWRGESGEERGGWPLRSPAVPLLL
jgi:hypothetical protein